MGDFEFSFAEFERKSPDTFRELWKENDFVNVTLAANDDFQISAHKIILSASSPLLKKILKKNPHENPLIYLHNIGSTELELILKFIYLGSCHVAQASLIQFLAAAKALGIRGLADETDEVADKAGQQTDGQQTGDDGGERPGLSENSGGDNQNTEFQSDFSFTISDENEEMQIIEKQVTGQVEEAGVKLENIEELLGTNVMWSFAKSKTKETANSSFTESKTKETQNSSFAESRTKETQNSYFTESRTKETANSYEIHNSEFSTESTRDPTGRIISTRYNNEEFIRNTVGHFECKQCHYKNLKPGKLIRHVIAVHEKRKFDCSFCNFKTGYKNALQSHIQVVHKGIRFSCKECDFSANSRTILSSHMRSVHKLFRRVRPAVNNSF